MNVLLIIFSFNIGGIERLIIDMISKMVDKGYHVSLCIINDDYNPTLLSKLSSLPDIIKLNRPKGCKHNIPYMNKLASIVSRKHIQIIHCHGLNCVLFSSIAKLRNPSLIIINTVHDTVDYPSYSRPKVLLSNIFLDQTIAISHTVEDTIINNGVSPHKVCTIYNAINTSRFQPHANHYSHINNNKKVYIGNVARFFPSKKGQDILTKALLLLLPLYPNLVCYFAGGVVEGQEKAFDSWQSYIKNNGLETHIKYLGDIDNVPDLLSHLNLFVLPSNYEGFGISLIEAISCGIPCIASDLEGPQEIFQLADKDQVLIGSLFSPGDEIELAERISYCIDNIDKFKPAEMHNFVETHFSIDSMVDKHIALYKSLLNS